MTRFPTLFALLATAAVAGAAPALAQMPGAGPTDPGPMELGPTELGAMDADGDGAITRAEAEAFRTERFRAADTDANGRLDRAELTAGITARMEAARQARLASRAERLATRILDAEDGNGDGVIELDEAPVSTADRIFRRIDRDDDGSLSAEEQAAFRERMAERRGRAGREHGRAHGRGYGAHHGAMGQSGSPLPTEMAPDGAPAPADDPLAPDTETDYT